LPNFWSASTIVNSLALLPAMRFPTLHIRPVPVSQDALDADQRPAGVAGGRSPRAAPGVGGQGGGANGLVKDAAVIRRMFGAIAPRYDLLNHLLSGGLDLHWRRAAVSALLSHLAPGSDRSEREQGARPSAGAGGWRVLDLCAGTLDLSCALSDSRRFVGRSLALDFALPMLRRGRRKLGGRRARQIVPLCGDGLRLPFREASFDAAMVAFGVRNFEDLDRGLAEARRALVPGGLLLVLEFSRPANPVFRAFYEAYSRRVLPAVGGAISGHGAAYRYLPASVAEFPDARGLTERLEHARFEEVRHRMLTGGIVALHTGLKPLAGRGSLTNGPAGRAAG
jgi:demethylmenaquinone methyltransferase/2-methoxy-6-polyprenyl-1,4-benzoquinol methylase